MTVQQLRELLSEAPDDMEVYIGFSDDVLGMFKFTPACSADSGIIEFGESDEDEIGDFEGKGFVMFPHGIAVAEEGMPDDEEEDSFHPQMN